MDRVERYGRRPVASHRGAPGFSLLEAVLALCLGSLVCALATGLFSAQQQLAREQQARTVQADAARTVFTVLPAELRVLNPATDIHGLGPDSVAARLFRGIAVTCGAGGSGTIVRYRGMRAPDPAKDSVLLLPAPGQETALSLTAAGPLGATDSASAAASSCAAAEGFELARWSLDTQPPPAALLLLFESGSYFLTNRAFRYRLGAAGRQPLTAEVFDDRVSAFTPGGAGPSWIDLSLATNPELFAPGAAVHRYQIRVPFLNSGPEPPPGP